MSEHTVIEEVRALAEELDRDDVRLALEQVRSLSADPVATVIVAGESGRGKSLLINALLAVDICPVGVGPTSTTFLSIRHDAEPGATAYTRAAPYGTAIDLDGLDAWTSERGNRRNERQVGLVEVRVPSVLLRTGLQLVDTPGVDGPTSAKQEVTLAALATADALLFVTDADAPISKPERDFLVAASARIDSVLLVVSKADRYDEAAEIAAINRRLIATTVPRLVDAPVFCISSTDAHDARLHGDELLAASSGVPDLEEYLRTEIAGRAARLRVRNLAVAVDQALDELERPLRADLVTGDPDDAATRLALARSDLAEHNERTKGWSSLLFVEFQRRVSHPLQLEFRRRIRALSERYEAAPTSRDLEALADDLDAELQVLVATTRRQLDDLAQRLCDHLCDVLRVSASTDEKPAPDADDVDLPSVRVEGPRAGAPVARKMTRFGSAARSALYGRSLAAAMGPIGLVVGVVVAGLGVVGSELGQRGDRSERAARELLQRAMETARIEVDADMRSRLLDVQQSVQLETQTMIARRKAELTQDIAQLELALRAESGARDAAQAVAREQLERCETLRSRSRSLIDQARALSRADTTGLRPASTRTTS